MEVLLETLEGILKQSQIIFDESRIDYKSTERTLKLKGKVMNRN